MSWITLYEKLRTGNARLDGAHEKLVNLINQMAEGMENNKTKEFCSNLLEQFIEQTKIHFVLEERLMDTLKYPKAREHKAIHEALINDVLTFKTSYDASAGAKSAMLLTILDTWLTRDIMTADKDLVAFIAAARAK
jgi:hemerythrin